MLQRLYIRNYAIIDEIDIEFSGGMNAITGETGAGKSILMGALGLILGDRADASMLLEKDKKCLIEGKFCRPGAGVRELLIMEELVDDSEATQDNTDDEESEVILRREVSATGKSRAFVNDTPVSLQQLRAIASGLVDLHRQFDTQEVGESSFQKSVLDAVAGQLTAANEYRSRFRLWKQAAANLEELRRRKQDLEKEAGYQQFLLGELDEAAFKSGELEALETELQALTHSGEISTVLSSVREALEDGNEPVISQLRQMTGKLRQLSAYQQDLGLLADRLESVQIELRDISSEVEAGAARVQSDPARESGIQVRLDEGFRLLRKHSVKTTEELLHIRDELKGKLRTAEHLDEAIVQAAKDHDELQASLQILAKGLTEGRKKKSPGLETSVNKLLKKVGMPNAALSIRLAPSALNEDGADEVDFLFDANGNGRLEPLRKVASGGELSRLMLAIKSLVADSLDMPTLIFDEIDSGISGEAARQVGIIMKDLGQKRQVICITHQPQIAGMAETHFSVYKSARADGVRTGIETLGYEARIQALARMLSGEQPTEAALSHAREMISV